MAKKKKKTGHKSIAELDQQARRFIGNGKSRQAIDTIKTLLKREEREEWRTLLNNAYLARSRELSEIGMLKEASEILGNITGSQIQNTTSVDYFETLIQSKSYDKAIEYLSGRISEQNPVAEKLSAIIVLLALNSGQEIIWQFAPLPHAKIVLNALDALAEGQDAQCQELIAQIPFSSPFKDFKIIIRGLLSFYNSDRQDALKRFQVIPQTSSLKKLADKLIEITRTNYEDLLSHAFHQMGEDARNLFLLLKGFRYADILNLKNIQKTLESRDYKSFFSLISQNRGLIDPTDLKNFSYSIIVEQPDIKKSYENKFARVPSYDYTRLRALYAEKDGDVHKAVWEWYSLTNSLPEKIFPSEEVFNLAIALILRRTVSLRESLFKNYDFDHSDLCEVLEDSLDFDPDDIETYVKLISLSQVSNQTKEALKYQDRALKRFPDSEELLYTASEMAYKRNALKKAVGYLDQILAKNPINAQALDKKIFIHIRKARKHIQDGKFHLARKEFELADSIENSRPHDGSVKIKWGLMEFLAGNIEQGEKLLEKGIQNAGVHIGTFFSLDIESRRMRLPPKFKHPFLQLFKKAYKDIATPENTHLLIKTISFYKDFEYPNIAEDYKLVIRYLSYLRTSRIPLDYLKTFCYFLFTRNEMLRLKLFVRSGKKRFPGVAIFTVYDLLDKFKSSFSKITEEDFNQLEEAFNKATLQGDTQGLEEIQQTLSLVRILKLQRENIDDSIFDDDMDEFESEYDEYEPDDIDFDDIIPRRTIRPPRLRRKDQGRDPNQFNLFNDD